MNLSDFHLLRPLWLLALPAWLWLAWWVTQGLGEGRWRKLIDPRLMPHVLVRAARSRQGRRLAGLIALWGVLVIGALAGPTWQKRPVPVYRPDLPLLVLFDVSRSMDGDDLRPTRLRRARFLLEDVIDAYRAGPIGLYAFSARPFLVAPPTHDRRTLHHLSASLSTDLVPVQGSRLDLALKRALDDLDQTAVPRANVLLFTDQHRPQPEALMLAARFRQAGHRLNVVAVGTPEGAPVPVPGGLARDARGQLVVTRPDVGFLGNLARAGGGGLFRLDGKTPLSAMQILQAMLQPGPERQRQETTERADQWVEAGPWLLLPALLLAA
ncbi:MAG TPA: VWA domain-containing protein, partial [Chromatiales bacterium]|nr:VWA domain-containing protein [Chromatiales bacterium]